ncbi:MAG: hypothetical protein ACREVM_10090, partial [Burkholderiales bacterium]
METGLLRAALVWAFKESFLSPQRMMSRPGVPLIIGSIQKKFRMNFALTDDQALIRDTAESFL